MTKKTAFTPWENLSLGQMYRALPQGTRDYIRAMKRRGSTVWDLVLEDEFRLEQEEFINEYLEFQQEIEFHDTYGNYNRL